MPLDVDLQLKVAVQSDDKDEKRMRGMVVVVVVGLLIVDWWTAGDWR